MRKSLLFLLGAAVAVPQINAVENKAVKLDTRIVSGLNAVENFSVPYTATGLSFFKDAYNQVSVAEDAQFSIGMWYKANGTGGNYNRNHVFAINKDKTECSTWTHWMVSCDSSGKYYFNVRDNNGGLQESDDFHPNENDKADNPGYNLGLECDLGTHALGEWHHLIVAVDNANKKVRIFFNGELDKEITLTAPLTFAESYLCQFGYMGSNATGNIFDEAQFFNKALTADEAAAAYVNAANVEGIASVYTFSEVADGTTGTFNNALIGGPEITGSVFKKTYGAYWGAPYNYYNYQDKSEIAPTLQEGRDISELTVDLKVNAPENGTLTVTNLEDNSAVEAGEHTVAAQGMYNVVAAPADGYAIVGVYAKTVNGETVLVNGSDICVLGNTELSARFTNQFSTVTFVAENPMPFVVYHNGVQVATNEDENFGAIQGETYKIVFTVPFELELQGITVDGQEIAAVDNACEFTVGENTNKVVVNATPKQTFAVTIEQPMVDGVAAGTVTVTGVNGEIANGDKAIIGDELTVSFVPADGYRFRHYIINGELTAANSIVVEDAVSFGVEAEAGNEYPALTHSFANGVGQSNRLIKAMKQVGVEGYLFNAETQEELGYVSYDANDKSKGAVINKTGVRAGHFQIDASTRQFSLMFTPYWGTVMTTEGSKNSEVKWTNFLVYVDWNGDGDFADEGESCYWDNDQAGTDTHFTTEEGCTGVINVPAGVKEGTYRMRFILYEPNAWPYTEESRQQAFEQYASTLTNINNGVAYDFDVDVASDRLEASRKVTFESNFAAAGTVAVVTDGTETCAPLPADATIEGTSVTTDFKYVPATATAAENASFLNWADKNGANISSEATYVYTGTEDATLTAVFGFAVNTEAEGEGRLSIASGNDNYVSGSIIPAGNKVTITPVAEQGYELSTLTLNGDAVEVASDGTYTFTLDGPANIAATFGVHTYTITYAATGEGALTVGSEYDEATNTVVDAVENGAEVSDDNLFFCVAKADATQEINWIKYTIDGIVTVVYDKNGESDVEVADVYSEDADAWFIGASGIGFVVYGATADYVITADFTGNGSGINGVELDAANGVVEYYNLQGVKVAAENLAPGFYIARQGNKAVKVLINK